MPCGPRDKFSTTTRSHDSTKFSRPCDDNLIDYCGTRTPDGTSSLFFLSTMRRLVRLLPNSNSEWDTLPIFLIHKMTYSTTAVLDFGWDMLPISQEDFHIHELTTIDYYGTRSEKRQHLKKGYSSTRWRSTKKHNLYIHSRWSIKKFSQKELANSLTKKSYSHGKYSTPYWSINFTI